MTEEYETPQWWDIVTEEKNAILDGTDIEPIVWVTTILPAITGLD